MIKLKAALLAIFSLFLTINISQGQETQYYTEPDVVYRKALDLYNRGLYANSQKLFEEYIKISDRDVNHLKTESEFYRAMCAIELDNNDAEYLIVTFINNHPESQKIDLAYFAMGKMQYQQKKYTKSISWLSKIDKNGMTRISNLRCNSSWGIAISLTNDFDNAINGCTRLKMLTTNLRLPQRTTTRTLPISKEIRHRVKGFEKLKENETFAPIVPFYISQIYYLQGDYSKVVSYSPPLLKDNTTKRTPEIARIIGESYFKLKQYDSAVVYLEKYAEKTQQLTRDDHYLIGFAYYKNQKYADAAKYLERVSTTDDSLSQNAHYHLADCYLQQNDKAKARQAFGMASKLDFDGIIKEDALFTYAKLPTNNFTLRSTRQLMHSARTFNYTQILLVPTRHTTI
jgi:TolA-binding protein